jgi:uncharacterized membrane protein YedE/YeeE
MFDSPDKLALGFLSGIMFGFLLQKGRVAKFEVILGQFLLKDWRVLKIMLTAIAVGSLGVYALVEGDMATLSVKPFVYGGILIGAVLFGVGMAIFGLCPGTSVAACGEGNRHAMVGVLGMFAGAATFVAAYPLVDPLISGFGDAGKVTIPEWLQISPWLAIVGLLLVVTAVLFGVEFWERRPWRGATATRLIPKSVAPRRRATQ